MKQNADRYRREQNFLPGEMVKLRTGLLDSRDKHKLDPYWSGPYKILNVNDNNTVQLELPPGSTVHPVFNLQTPKRQPVAPGIAKLALQGTDKT